MSKKVQFRTKWRDLAAFCLYHQLRSPLVFGTCSTGFALVSLGTVLAAMKLDASPSKKLIAFFGLEIMVFLLFAFLFVVIVLLDMVAYRKLMETQLTEHTITLSDANFVEETTTNSSVCLWSGVQKLARTPWHIFIYVSKQAAHVIPRRAFNNDADWEAFYSFCKRMTRAA
jgi:hypothetical protein